MRDKKINKNLYLQDAHLYDLDDRDLLKVDISFYVEFAFKIKGPILELACGTGRITIPIAEAGHEIWAIELSDTMIEQFRLKIGNLSQETAARIHLVQGDMSNFVLERMFPLVIIPYRSFQILQDETLEIACLKSVYRHLTDNGYFIIDLGNFAKIEESEWESDKEILDWANVEPGTGYVVCRAHKKKGMDKQNQVVHLQKTYYITKDDGSVEKIFKRVSAKYFHERQIKNLLISNGFKIVKEMGFYDGRPIGEGSEFIFICQKK